MNNNKKLLKTAVCPVFAVKSKPSNGEGECTGALTDPGSSKSGHDIDLDLCLAFESEEQLQSNAKLDQMDILIEENRRNAEERNRILENELEIIRSTVKSREKQMDLNGLRARKLSQISLDQVKALAQSTISEIGDDEKSESVTTRRKLYHGSSGEQQSLFYKQIWGPFSDEQHGEFLT